MPMQGVTDPWSTRLSRPGDLPAECAALLPDLSADFPYCVRSPAVHSFLISEPESFLFLTRSQVVIMKRGRKGISVFRSGLDALAALEAETTLLQSCLTFHPREGNPECIPFNSVAETLFQPVIEAFLAVRRAPVPGSDQLRSLRPDPFQDLRRRDFKYHTFAFIVLSPDGVKGRFYHSAEPVPGKFRRNRIIPSYLMVSSGSMLYAISEKRPTRSRKTADYSVLIRYIPLSQELSIGFRPLLREARYRMVVLRAGGSTFEMPLHRAFESEFADFARTLLDASGT